jgi:hypothetical protein
LISLIFDLVKETALYLQWEVDFVSGHVYLPLYFAISDVSIPAS